MNSLLPFFDYLRELNFAALFVKIVLSVFFGGIIGIGRGQKHRAAGCRTYMIVCLGATLTMILSQYEAHMLTVWADRLPFIVSTDVSRFGAQVINGIGFLGAGTIIVTGRQEVKGLTTAAGLWASACMGLAVGAGFYECAIMGFVLIIITVAPLDKFSSWIAYNSRNMDLYIEFGAIDDLGAIINKIKEMNIQIFDVDIRREKQPNGTFVSAVISTRLPKGLAHSKVMSSVSKFDFVTLVDEI